MDAGTVEGQASGKTVRQSNFELLRIVAIAFIILHHIAVHGDWGNGGMFFPEELTFNAVALQGFFGLGKIGVNAFVLISGYFLFGSVRSTWPKVVRLWAEMLFYSVLITSMFAVFDGYELTPRRAFIMFTPFISVTWWFATTYLLMLLLSPFVNKALGSCDERTHLKLIIGFVVIWSIVPTVTNMPVLLSDLIWFIVLYVIGAYIARYPRHFGWNSGKYAAFTLGIYLLMVVLMVIVDATHLESELWDQHNYVNVIQWQNDILVLAASVFLFLAFRNMRAFHSKIINYLATAVFGVYLIHDMGLVRGYIYDRLFDCNGFTDSPFMVFYVLGIMLAILIVCTVIELVRIELMDKRLLKGLPDAVLRAQNRYDEWIDGIVGKDDDRS